MNRNAHRTQVTLLGGFGVECGGRIVLSRAAQRLVAYLALTGQPSRAAVAGHLWPDQPEARAMNSLRSALHRVESRCPGLVARTSDTLSLSSDVRVDAREVLDWAEATLLPDNPRASASPPAGVFTKELLPGWYDDWVQLERERLQQLRVHAVERWAAQLIEVGDFGAALHAAYSVIRAEPLRETAHRMIVAVHIAQGNHAEALRQYTHFRAALARELGIEPSAHITSLLDPVRRVPRSRQGQTPKPEPGP